MMKHVAKVTTQITNQWFVITILVNIIFLPIELLLHRRNNLVDLIQATGQVIQDYGLAGLGLMVLLLAAGWLILFLIIFFFVWLNQALAKRDYFHK
ncbi:hypothetical protein YK48G_06550 [Lentilactobacillus fungorum]|uniref:Uncharacterized protein n=1 Tax=Lentilactobacillus fungorum TaxID=2201250 RepID=A0ABQ3VXF7_9LACO|nr:hypothetical protein [Lentilactobacillus fungorum]GHP13230.1 hypothetical protein YK48G_06550 [Lentilactobacillus fungorum]